MKSSRGIVRAAREALGMTQVEFGKWIARELKRKNPIPQQRITEWETGRKSPRRNVRAVCLLVVANKIADDAEHRILAGDDPAAIRAMICNRIITDTL